MKSSIFPKLSTLLILFSVSLWSCQTDDIKVVDNSLGNDISDPFLKNINSINSSPEWKKTFKVGDNFYIPLEKSIFKFSLLADKNKNSKLFPFILFQKDNNNRYSENLIVFVDFKKNKTKNRDILNLPYILFNQSNDLLSSSFEKSNSSHILKSNAECVEWGLYLITEYTDGSTSEELLYSFWICGGNEEEEDDDGESGGSGGGSSEASLLDNFLNQTVWDLNEPYDPWNKLTECEKVFFTNHPLLLVNAIINRYMAEEATAELFPNCPAYNDLGDAFRHAYFAALNYRNMGYTNAKYLGDVPQEYLNETEMDLHNNQWGYVYASENIGFSEIDFYEAFIAANNNNELITLINCN